MILTTVAFEVRTCLRFLAGGKFLEVDNRTRQTCSCILLSSLYPASVVREGYLKGHHVLGLRGLNGVRFSCEWPQGPLGGGSACAPRFKAEQMDESREPVVISFIRLSVDRSFEREEHKRPKRWLYTHRKRGAQALLGCGRFEGALPTATLARAFWFLEWGKDVPEAFNCVKYMGSPKHDAQPD